MPVSVIGGGVFVSVTLTHILVKGISHFLLKEYSDFQITSLKNNED